MEVSQVKHFVFFGGLRQVTPAVQDSNLSLIYLPFQSNCILFLDSFMFFNLQPEQNLAQSPRPEVVEKACISSYTSTKVNSQTELLISLRKVLPSQSEVF